MLVMFEATVVKRRLAHLEDLRSMRVPPHKIYVFRNKKWTEIRSDQLLPKDICSLVRSEKEMVCPCDMLILNGNCVVDEALLTGESIPQLKESIDNCDENEILDIKKEHKRYIIYGGTKILLQNEAKQPLKHIKPPPDHGCIAFVLRTGFNTSQGKLIRTILFSTERVSINNVESLLFILFLLVFAVAASAYVLVKGLEDPNRSRYKLMLNCIMIITSVVPPELPMELSLAVNTSLIALIKQNIYCTEPFRIPLAGAVDVCCFDKTGTLTSDAFIVNGVAGIGPNAAGDISEIMSAENLPDDVRFVIAGCHSLTHINNQIIGDPLEKASFKAINWYYVKGDIAISRPGGRMRVRIIHRYPFSSSLKRMTCVISLDHQQNPQLRVVTKGAAEVMESRFKSIPANYEATHKHFSRQGCRVLAMGYKLLGQASPDQQKKMKSWNRDEVESDLIFAGFLVLQCPLKPDSQLTISHLIYSSHKVVMITGDHVLTACSVAAELKFTEKPVLILTHNKNGCEWISIDQTVHLPFDPKCDEKSLSQMNEKYDLCVSGDSFEYILFTMRIPSFLVGRLILFVSVFARTSPDQKEFILKWLKQNGLTTLMCGDGTNDVGALKQAHVGVALIGNEIKMEQISSASDNDTSRSSAPSISSNAKDKRQGTTGGAGTTAGAGGGNQLSYPYNTPQFQQQVQLYQQKGMNLQMAQMMAKMEQDMKDEEKTVRLGDASIASPFTSKVPYISSTVHIIRQGRCTLVTTLQMFQILALNCLVSAYSMSVLYLDGVKMGDIQMTIAGLSVAMFFFCISRSKPLEKLSPEKPHSKLFTFHMFMAVMGQFAIHMFVLILAVSWAHPHTPTDKEDRDPDTDFKPNVLNTVVYIISSSMTIATFLANYRGEPFMESLTENKVLFYSLIGSAGFMLLLASEIFTSVNEMMQLAPFPDPKFRLSLMVLILFDLWSTILYGRFIRWIFALHPKKSISSSKSSSFPPPPPRLQSPATSGNVKNRGKQKFN